MLVLEAFDFGGKWVYFDQSELSGFGTEDGLGAAGLTLLGFKDREKLKEQVENKLAKDDPNNLNR